MTKRKLWNDKHPRAILDISNGAAMLHITIFFHPDCTVGFGVTPNHALRLVGYTTGRELHPALKMGCLLNEASIRPDMRFVKPEFFRTLKSGSDTAIGLE